MIFLLFSIAKGSEEPENGLSADIFNISMSWPLCPGYIVTTDINRTVEVDNGGYSPINTLPEPIFKNSTNSTTLSTVVGHEDLDIINLVFMILFVSMGVFQLFGVIFHSFETASHKISRTRLINFSQKR